MLDAIISFFNESNNIGSLVAGLLVFAIGTFVVFLIRDFYKKPPSFSGMFYLKTTTIESKVSDYKNLSSFYKLTLINESTTKAIGKIEKTEDIEPNNKHRKYFGRNRNVGDVILTIERYFLRFNKMNIHIIFDGDPNGAQRGSSLVVQLKRATHKTNGNFATTAADSSGTASFQNEEFDEIKNK